MKNRRSLRETTRYAILISLLLIVMNMALGAALVHQSKQAMKTVIRSRMMDISSSAADLVDGDVLGRLRKEDEDTPEYQETLQILKVFQDNIALEYIYGIRDMGDGTYTFTVDPAVEDPGEFGAPVAVTDALVRAFTGVDTVDEEPYADAWGHFYSAYSPVFDSEGKVAGVIAVDFSAAWYDGQVRKSILTVVVGCVLSLVAGLAIMLVLTGRMRRRFRTIYSDLNTLSGEIESLNAKVSDQEIGGIGLSGPEENAMKNAGEYIDIGLLAEKIRIIQDQLHAYISFLRSQATIDKMTGVNNKAAYMKVEEDLDRQILEADPEFTIGVFDVNGLKNINDNYGHAIGDRVIIDAANVIRHVFGGKNTFRVGGDEFIVVLNGAVKPRALEQLAENMEEELLRFNRQERSYPTDLAISAGFASYSRGKDQNYLSVFRRADEAMYRNKAEYYEKHADQRRKPET
ncbi:MAG: diguanylate cyclase [Lachnospiraceae bacterium]|nr:diguanylate cyclase [Lachnospiraceae bacterium]